MTHKIIALSHSGVFVVKYKNIIITSSHLMKHLETNNLLYEYQHSFHLVKHNYVVSFINDLAKSYDNGKQTDVIFMDIAKAFDTRLRHKLQWYGIVGNTYQ